MNVADFQLPMYYIHQIAEQISSLGGDRRAWLAKNQLHEAQLTDSHSTLPFVTFHQLIVDALKMTQEPALGLLIGERLLVNTHGILGYAAMNSSTIRQAVEIFERYIRLRTPLVSTHHEIHGKQFRIVFDEPYPLGDVRRPVLEAIVLTIKNVLDYITMGSRHVQMAAFPFATPAYPALAADMFNCPVHYQQDWTGFALPLAVVDLPLKMNDPTTFREATQICQRELEKLSRNESLAMRVRRVMLEKGNGFPSLNVTARLFHLTPRTLHRHLLEEGTSYKTILEEVRHNLAVEHLKSGYLSIQEIAFSLGYTDIANFRRAFKRWEGVPPSDYRNAHSDNRIGNSIANV